MSATITTVGRLVEQLIKHRGDTLIAVVSPWEVDLIEGEVDGPVKPYLMWAHEVRTGWNLIAKDTYCTVCGEPANDEIVHTKLLILTDQNEETLMENLAD